jgi:hypothetical protein
MTDTELDDANAVWLAQAEYRLKAAFKSFGYDADGKDKPLFDAAFERLELTVGKATAALAHHMENPE